MINGVFKRFFNQWQLSSFVNLIANSPSIVLIPVYLVLISSATLLAHDSGIINSSCPQFGDITLYSTPAEIIQCFGGSDIASYVRGAYALEEHGLNAFGSLGFGTWPPGFTFIELAIIRLNFVPLPMALFFITSFLWAVVFYRVYTLLKHSLGIGVVSAAALPLLLLLLPFVSDYYLWNALLMSEPISTAIFAIAALDVWRLIASKHKITIGRAIFIGFLFALAAYVRAQFDLIVHTLAAVAFVVFAAWYYLSRGKEAQNRKRLIQLSRGIFIIFVTYQACVLPYKNYMSNFGHAPAMASVTYIFESLWRDGDWLIQHNAGFFVAGGGNSMCVIAPQKCQEFEDRREQGEAVTISEYRNAAFMVVLTQPFSLLNYKLPYFWKAWGGGEFGSFFEQTSTMMFNLVLFILILVAGIVRIIQNRTQGFIEATVFTALFVGSTLFCFIVHFEARYLLPVKLFGAIWVLLAMVSIGQSFFQKKEKTSIDNT